MHINRYDPWRLVTRPHAYRLQNGRSEDRRTWVPAVDVREEADRFVIRADVPGVDPKDLDITMEKGVLTIRGSRDTRGGNGSEGYRHAERVDGAFERRFTLPRAVDADAVSADYRSGVLTVTIPKEPSALARRIPVELN